MWKSKKTPWSKLQRELYKLRAPELEFQIHCATMRMECGSTDLPRYWITLGKKIIWDYPKDFSECHGPGMYKKPVYLRGGYPYETDVSDISCLTREYIDTPTDILLNKAFENDFWNLTDILKAMDRRIGKPHLEALEKRTKSFAAERVIAARFGETVTTRFTRDIKISLPPDFDEKEAMMEILCEKYGLPYKKPERKDKEPK